MAIYDFFLSRNNAVSTPANYVGHAGRLFYDGANGVIKLSDGVTPGGLSIPYTIASDTVIGGIKAGPGVSINSEGQLLIDSEGLTFSFGDLQGMVGTYAAGHPDAGEDYALLQSLHLNEDIVIASNGTGVVKILGDFSVRAANSDIDAVLLAEPVLRVAADGQIRMLTPLADSTTGALEIVGNNTGTFYPPTQTGVILHVTGNSNLVCRNYFDANNNYALLAGRRYNGNVQMPTPVLNNQILFRLVAQGTVDDGTFSTFGPARISFYANEDQTVTAQGGRIAFEITKNGFAADGTGTNTISVASMDAQTGLTAIQFNGPLTGNVAGNVSGTNGTFTTVTGTVNTAAQPNITSVGTLTSLAVTGNVAAGNVAATKGTFTNFTGKYVRNYRDAGVIADGGTVTINFATDAVVYCQWDNNFTLAYSNYSPGSLVKLIAFKRAGTGTDNFSLDGIDAGHVSTGSTTVSGTAGIANFIEFICTGTDINSVFAQL